MFDTIDVFVSREDYDDVQYAAEYSMPSESKSNSTVALATQWNWIRPKLILIKIIHLY